MLDTLSLEEKGSLLTDLFRTINALYTTIHDVRLRKFLPHIKSVFDYMREHQLDAHTGSASYITLCCHLSVLQSQYETPSLGLETLSKIDIQGEVFQKDPELPYRYWHAHTHLYWEQGDMLASLHSEERCLTYAIRLQQFDYINVVYHGLGALYHKLGRLEEAIRNARLAVQTLQSIPGYEKNERWLGNLAKGYILLVFFYSHASQHSEAKAALESARKILVNDLSESLETDCLFNEASGGLYLGEDDSKARHFFTLSLKARESTYGKRHRLVAQTKCGLARSRERLQESVSAFEEALEMLFSLYGSDNNIYIADCYYDIAKCLFGHQKFVTAKLFFLCFINVMDQVLGEKDSREHCDVKDSLRLLEEHYHVISPIQLRQILYRNKRDVLLREFHRAHLIEELRAARTSTAKENEGARPILLTPRDCLFFTVGIVAGAVLVGSSLMIAQQTKGSFHP